MSLDLAPLEGHTASIESITFLGGHIYTASKDGAAKKWSTEPRTHVAKEESAYGDGGSLVGASLAPDIKTQDMIYTAGNSPLEAKQWRASDNALLCTMEHPAPVVAVAAHDGYFRIKGHR